VKRTSTTPDEIRDRLCEDILSGQLPPGTPLTVAALVKRYGAGTMSIRAALQELRGRGLITAEPNRGARVRRVDEEIINNIFELRHAVWGIVVPRCVRFITNADIEELERIQDQMEVATATGDMTQILRHNNAFHNLIYSTARNPEAADVLKRSWLLINGLRAVFGYGPGRLAGTNSMHRSLIKVLRTRDSDKALNLVRTSADRSREDLIRLIANAKANPYEASGASRPAA